MSVDSIATVNATDAVQAVAQVKTLGSPNVQTGEFTQMVSHGLAEVNSQLLATQTDLQQLAAGNVQNLHQVMINMEEARISFQLMVQVRNRALEAYQDLMKTPV